RDPLRNQFLGIEAGGQEEKPEDKTPSGGMKLDDKFEKGFPNAAYVFTRDEQNGKFVIKGSDGRTFDIAPFEGELDMNSVQMVSDPEGNVHAYFVTAYKDASGEGLYAIYSERGLVMNGMKTRGRLLAVVGRNQEGDRILPHVYFSGNRASDGKWISCGDEEVLEEEAPFFENRPIVDSKGDIRLYSRVQTPEGFYEIFDDLGVSCGRFEDVMEWDLIEDGEGNIHVYVLARAGSEYGLYEGSKLIRGGLKNATGLALICDGEGKTHAYFWASMGAQDFKLYNEEGLVRERSSTFPFYGQFISVYPPKLALDGNGKVRVFFAAQTDDRKWGVYDGDRQFSRGGFGKVIGPVLGLGSDGKVQPFFLTREGFQMGEPWDLWQGNESISGGYEFPSEKWGIYLIRASDGTLHPYFTDMEGWNVFNRDGNQSAAFGPLGRETVLDALFIKSLSRKPDDGGASDEEGVAPAEGTTGRSVLTGLTAEEIPNVFYAFVQDKDGNYFLRGSDGGIVPVAPFDGEIDIGAGISMIADRAGKVHVYFVVKKEGPGGTSYAIHSEAGLIQGGFTGFEGVKWPRGMLDGEGRVHVYYVTTDGDGNKGLYCDGKLVQDGFGVIYMPSYILDGEGKIHVYFKVNMREDQGRKPALYNQNGLFWEPTTREDVNIPDLILDGEGKVHVYYSVYVPQAASEPQVPIRVYNESGLVRGGLRSGYLMELIRDREGRVHAYFAAQDESARGEVGNYGLYDGENLICDGFDAISDLALILDGAGKIHAYFRGWRGQRWGIYDERGLEGNLSKRDFTELGAPKPICGGDGNIHVYFWGQKYEDIGIYSENGLIRDGFRRVKNPVPVLDREGRAHVYFHAEGEGGEYKVYNEEKCVNATHGQWDYKVLMDGEGRLHVYVCTSPVFDPPEIWSDGGNESDRFGGPFENVLTGKSLFVKQSADGSKDSGEGKTPAPEDDSDTKRIPAVPKEPSGEEGIPSAGTKPDGIRTGDVVTATVRDRQVFDDIDRFVEYLNNEFSLGIQGQGEALLFAGGGTEDPWVEIMKKWYSWGDISSGIVIRNRIQSDGVFWGINIASRGGSPEWRMIEEVNSEDFESLLLFLSRNFFAVYYTKLETEDGDILHDIRIKFGRKKEEFRKDYDKYQPKTGKRKPPFDELFKTIESADGHRIEFIFQEDENEKDLRGSEIGETRQILRPGTNPKKVGKFRRRLSEVPAKKAEPPVVPGKQTPFRKALDIARRFLRPKGSSLGSPDREAYLVSREAQGKDRETYLVHRETQAKEREALNVKRSRGEKNERVQSGKRKITTDFLLSNPAFSILSSFFGLRDTIHDSRDTVFASSLGALDPRNENPDLVAEEGNMPGFSYYRFRRKSDREVIFNYFILTFKAPDGVLHRFEFLMNLPDGVIQTAHGAGPDPESLTKNMESVPVRAFAGQVATIVPSEQFSEGEKGIEIEVDPSYAEEFSGAGIPLEEVVRLFNPEPDASRGETGEGIPCRIRILESQDGTKVKEQKPDDRGPKGASILLDPFASDRFPAVKRIDSIKPTGRVIKGHEVTTGTLFSGTPYMHDSLLNSSSLIRLDDGRFFVGIPHGGGFLREFFFDEDDWQEGTVVANRQKIKDVDGDEILKPSNGVRLDEDRVLILNASQNLFQEYVRNAQGEWNPGRLTFNEKIDGIDTLSGPHSVICLAPDRILIGNGGNNTLREFVLLDGEWLPGAVIEVESAGAMILLEPDRIMVAVRGDTLREYEFKNGEWKKSREIKNREIDGVQTIQSPDVLIRLDKDRLLVDSWQQRCQDTLTELYFNGQEWEQRIVYVSVDRDAAENSTSFMRDLIRTGRNRLLVLSDEGIDNARVVELEIEGDFDDDRLIDDVNALNDSDATETEIPFSGRFSPLDVVEQAVRNERLKKLRSAIEKMNGELLKGVLAKIAIDSTKKKWGNPLSKEKYDDEDRRIIGLLLRALPFTEENGVFRSDLEKLFVSDIGSLRQFLIDFHQALQKASDLMGGNAEISGKEKIQPLIDFLAIYSGKITLIPIVRIFKDVFGSRATLEAIRALLLTEPAQSQAPDSNQETGAAMTGLPTLDDYPEVKAFFEQWASEIRRVLEDVRGGRGDVLVGFRHSASRLDVDRVQLKADGTVFLDLLRKDGAAALVREEFNFPISDVADVFYDEESGILYVVVKEGPFGMDQISGNRFRNVVGFPAEPGIHDILPVQIKNNAIWIRPGPPPPVPVLQDGEGMALETAEDIRGYMNERSTRASNDPRFYSVSEDESERKVNWRRNNPKNTRYQYSDAERKGVFHLPVMGGEQLWKFLIKFMWAGGSRRVAMEFFEVKPGGRGTAEIDVTPYFRSLLALRDLTASPHFEFRFSELPEEIMALVREAGIDLEEIRLAQEADASGKPGGSARDTAAILIQNDAPEAEGN
ncbi:MAG TPA: hypothetical protein PKL97_09585, partial [Candidatus Omnitrophota bacterium]|nr:hypothetical protein [Candidatus Omnitrophota bacterium]